jgi:transcriptional regulator with XRE-family HTH domain
MKPPVHASIGKRVRWARTQSGYTLDGLAAAMGTTRQTIIRWEKGFYSPNAESRKKLAAATGQDTSFFSDSADEGEDDADADPAMSLGALLEQRIRAIVDEQLRQIPR